jgi:hypothetical protein
MHSYYALMGGFAFETEDEGEDPYIPGSPQILLTCRGVEEIAKLGFLPDISKKYIEDKSKADNIAKGLVLVQASWLILQCITRWASHLTVTPLEVNTLAHAICALCMYFLWWNKPLDVHDPTIISGEWVRPTCAWMWMSSRSGNRTGRVINRIFEPRLPGELSSLVWLDKEDSPRISNDGLIGETRLSIEGSSAVANSSAAQVLPVGSQDITADNHQSQIATNLHLNITLKSAKILNLRRNSLSSRQMVHDTSISDANSVFRIYPYEVAMPMGFGPRDNYIQDPAQRTTQDPTPGGFSVDEVTLERWRLANQFYREIGSSSHTYFRNRSLLPASGAIHQDRRQEVYSFDVGEFTFVNVKSRNWPGDDDYYSDLDQSVAIFILSAVAYGGIHFAVAWSENFPTALEQLLWKISAAYIAGIGLIAMPMPQIGSYIGDKFQHTALRKKYEKTVPDGVRDILKEGLILLIWVILAPAFLFYVFARTFLVVEAFISLRSLPIGAYNTPDWTQFLPHF